jgi:thioredoxin 1
MSELIQHINDQQFQGAVASGVTLVDFWAPWCNPCRAIAPILDELAAELQGKVKIVKVNVDESPDTAGRYGIMSIPTLLIFKDGQKVDQKVGGASKAALKAFIEGAL